MDDNILVIGIVGGGNMRTPFFLRHTLQLSISENSRRFLQTFFLFGRIFRSLHKGAPKGNLLPLAQLPAKV